MKNLYTLFLIAFTSLSLSAQLEFNASNIPAPGTVYTYREGMAQTFPASVSGNSWSFSTTDFLANDSSRYTYKSIAETPEAQYFPDANLVKERILYNNEFGMPQNIDTLLYFYRYDATGMYYHGLCPAGQEPYYPYVGETIEFPMPMTVGATILRDTIIDSYFSSGADSVFQRLYESRTYNVVASGTLDIMGISHEVLAVSFDYSGLDSSFNYSNAANQWVYSFTSDVSSNKYFFYSPAIGAEVLTGEFYNTEGADWTVSFITNAPITTGIQSNSPQQPLVFPNPSDGAFQVANLEPGKFLCSIYDMAGRLVQQEQVNSLFYTTSQLPSGDYLMVLESQDEKIRFSRKLAVN